MDCLFEGSSGFTTTGAAILPDIEILLRGISSGAASPTGWGGMGVLAPLLFFGSCSSSVGGGIQCARVLILLRILRREVRRIAHPRCVEVIKMDGRVLESSTIRGTLVFLGCYLLILLAAGLIISLDGYSSSALASLSNVGPGLELAGATGNFSLLSPLSKVAMSLCMVTGRLEIFPTLVLFSRAVWRHT